MKSDVRVCPFTEPAKLTYPLIITWNPQTRYIEFVPLPQEMTEKDCQKLDVKALLDKNSVESLLRHTAMMLYKYHKIYKLK